jgi:hypothetical protein
MDRWATIVVRGEPLPVVATFLHVLGRNDTGPTPRLFVCGETRQSIADSDLVEICNNLKCGICLQFFLTKETDLVFVASARAGGTVLDIDLGSLDAREIDWVVQRFLSFVELSAAELLLIDYDGRSAVGEYSLDEPAAIVDIVGSRELETADVVLGRLPIRGWSERGARWLKNYIVAGVAEV